MKLKIVGILLIFAMLPLTGAAKDLPTKDELLNFTENVTFTDNYPTAAMEELKANHSTWYADIWKDQENNTYFSSYYHANTSKGYWSVYYDESGKRLEDVCFIDFRLVEQYPPKRTGNITVIIENESHDEPRPILIQNETSEMTFSINNSTSNESVNMKAQLNEPVSKEKARSFAESIYHLILAIKGAI